LSTGVPFLTITSFTILYDTYPTDHSSVGLDRHFWLQIWLLKQGHFCKVFVIYCRDKISTGNYDIHTFVEKPVWESYFILAGLKLFKIVKLLLKQFCWRHYFVAGSWDNNVRCWEIDNTGTMYSVLYRYIPASSFLVKRTRIGTGTVPHRYLQNVLLNFILNLQANQCPKLSRRCRALF
jgi:hypothetical protein